MGMLCAVAFNKYGRLFYLDPGDLSPKVGDKVLVPTDDGPAVADCMWAPQWIDEDTSGFPRLSGLAGESDLRRDELIRQRKAEGRVAANRQVLLHPCAGQGSHQPLEHGFDAAIGRAPHDLQQAQWSVTHP